MPNPTTPTIADYLKYADLQMAAEAFLVNENGIPLTGKRYSDALITGNEHASAFTAPQAETFAVLWEVVDQKVNTGTGFSGTLFKARDNVESLGIHKGDLVMSMRSTEFLDDAARDNKATNTLEIKEFGVAFGQIDDMEQWYKELKAKQLIKPTDSFSVTGYSLGGHLATAFNLLRREEATTTGNPSPVKDVVTFNGAGVGVIDPTYTLTKLIQDFHDYRTNTKSITFSDPTLAALYARLRATIKGGATISFTDWQTLQNLVNPPVDSSITVDATTKKQAQMVLDAIGRIEAIQKEVAYVATVTDDGKHKIKDVANPQIESESLDYQMAVLLEKDHTDAASLLGGLIRAYRGKKIAENPLINQYDVQGEPYPSAVANSQWHYGTDVPIFIENQPVVRGGVALDVALNSIANLDVKLLVNDYSLKDFGDTHSLVLLVDSLNVQNTIYQLLNPTEKGKSGTLAIINTLLKEASYLKAENGDIAIGKGQGKAEGDVLENVVNVLADIFLGPDTTRERLKGNPGGATWWIKDDQPGGYSGRDRFYKRLAEITTVSTGSDFAGKFTLSISGAGLESAARNDFGAFLALYTLSPFVLRTQENTALQDALGKVWNSGSNNLYDLWKTDKATLGDPSKPQVFAITDQWLADRADFIARKQWFNGKNIDPVNLGYQYGSTDNVFQNDATYFEDVASGYRIAQGFNPDSPLASIQQFYFGDDADNTKTGGGVVDHLYGGGGNDKLDGGAGADYLDGGAGDDELKGGEGDYNDTLVSGGSTTDAGDTLIGGEGDDLYLVRKGDGTVHIKDTGANRLMIDGELFTGTFVEDADGKYTLKGKSGIKLQFDSSGVLTLDDGTTLIFDNQTSGAAFKDGDFGLHLIAAPTASSPDTTFTGDFTPIDRNPNESGIQYGHDPLGNLEVDKSKPDPGFEDTLFGTNANDLLKPGGGDDYADARDGNDRLEGDVGRDILLGGEGDDVVIGGEDADLLVGGLGDDRLFTAVEVTLEAAWTANDPASPPDPAQAELAQGNEGDDQVIGNSGADFLLGGTGADLILGGAGDDNIYGDAEATRAAREWQAVRQLNVIDAHHTHYVLDTPEVAWTMADAGGTAQGNADALYGGAGDDWVLGELGDDYLDGGSGNDALFGGADNDVLIGGDGNDILSGDDDGVPAERNGQDWLDGGDGNDTLHGGGNNDQLWGGAGDDELQGDTEDGPLPGDDQLHGGEGTDRLTGAGGNDSLWGDAGNDQLFGDGDTVATNAQGDDYLDGGKGDDYLRGYGGNDQLLGGEGDDQLLGEEGDDQLYGGAGNDTLDGGDGNDYLSGGDGSEALTGGAGNDTLEGGAGLDNLIGSEGDDTYLINVGDAPTGMTVEALIDTAGNDTVTFSGVNASQITLNYTPEGYLLITTPTDRVAIVDGLNGAMENYQFDDRTLNYTQLITQYANFGGTYTNAQGQTFYLGGTGSDSLRGSKQGITYLGSKGNDTITGQGGDTYVYNPGDGTDRITTAKATDAQGNALKNTVQFGAGITAVDLKLGLGSLKIQIGSDENDIIHLEGFNAADALNSTPIDEYRFDDGSVLTHAQLLARGFDIAGTSGNDTLIGTSVDDRISGGAGNDSLKGGLGNDTYYFNVGDGQDTIDNTDAGAGHSDTLVIGGTPAEVMLWRLGNDLVAGFLASIDTVTVKNHFSSTPIQTLKLSDGTNWDIAAIATHLTSPLTDRNDNYTGTTASETIYAKGGNDTVVGGGGNDYIDGGSGNDSLTGAGGQDTLVGGDGNDVLNGLVGNDSLLGGAGDDSLYGSDGNDTLDGGVGTDLLSGGLGTNTYIFGAGYGQDSAFIYDTVAPRSSTLKLVNLNIGDVTFKSTGIGDLIISVNGSSTNEYIQLNSFFSDPARQLARIEFFDGSVMDINGILDQPIYRLGGAGNDQISGLEGVRNYLAGNGGNDTLRSTTGNDTLDGGLGDDSLQGGGGNNLILGGDGADWADGGAGNDSIDGGAGYDYLWGGDGNDTLIGGLGGDRIQGGTGNDFLLGGADTDWLEGQDGNDTLDGGADGGIDTLSGGNGSDTYIFGRGYGRDTFGTYDTIARSDTLQLRDLAPNEIQLQRSSTDLYVNILSTSPTEYAYFQNYFQSTNYQLKQIVFSDGTVWDSAAILSKPLYWYGDAGANSITGTDGNDNYLVGNGGNDTLNGANGSDTLDGGPGNDSLKGGGGRDTYVFGRGYGLDYVDVNSVVYGDSASADILQLIGLSPADIQLQIRGSDLIFVVNGTNTSEYIQFGNFTYGAICPLTKVLFADGTVWNSSDLLNQTMYSFGGSGNDSLFGNYGTGMKVISGGDGNDTIYGGVSADSLDGGAGSDYLSGLDGNDSLFGGSGNDTMLGDAGDDFLDGGIGNDSLAGTAGNDAVSGGEGNDTLIGGQGADTLDGGGGDDRYIYNLGDGADLIVDSLGTDTLSFGSSVTSAQITSAWVGNEAVLKVSGSTAVRLAVSPANDLAVERVEFSNGTVWTQEDLRRRMNSAPTGAVAITGTPTQSRALTASNTLLDADGLGVVGYQWQSSADGAVWDVIPSATSSSFGLTQAEVGRKVRVVASYVDGHGSNESVASTATARVAADAGNSVPTGSVDIAGSVVQNQMLTASNTLVDADGIGAIGYQWQTSVDGGTTWTSIIGATAGTLGLSEAEVGKSIRAVASYIDGRGTTESVVSAATAVVANVNDVPSGGVAVAGVAAQNQVLTASNNLIDPDGLGTIAYQWQSSDDGGSSWIEIGGATGSSFTLSETQVGKLIRVSANYTDGHGTAENLVSAVTPVIANVNDAPTGGVTVTGLATQNQSLVAANTLADVDGMGSISYQWQSSADSGGSWTVISGATESTFVLTEAQVGKSVRVNASYTDGHGTVERLDSAPTAIVANVNDLPQGMVSINGLAVQGQVLVAGNTLSDPDGLGAIGYQWQASVDGTNWLEVEGATSGMLILAEGQVGGQVRVVASYTDGHGTTESVASIATASVANVNDAPTGRVSVVGTATQNQTLTASNALADSDGLGTISYQWQSSSDGTNWSDVLGATSSSFTLVEAQVDRQMRVVAAYVDGHGTQELVASEATESVVNVNDAPVGSVAVAGVAIQNQVLVANNTLVDADGIHAISYQWQSSTDGNQWTSIVGATGDAITLGEGQVGKHVRVLASYVDGHGAAESVPSLSVGVVGNINDSPIGEVKVSGTARQNEVLNASSDLVDIDGLGPMVYQWQTSADGENWAGLAGATGAMLTLTEAQVGRQVRAVVSYVDGHGTAEEVFSSATAVIINVNDSPTGGVDVTGNAIQNQALVVGNTLGDADGIGAVAYQWQTSIDGTTWSALAGAVGTTYTLTEAEVGSRIRVLASYVDGHGTAEQVASVVTAPVANVNDLPTGVVSVTGTAIQAQVLTATNTLADPDGLGAIVYQWQSSADGNSWSNIAGATANTFLLTDTQVGKQIRAVASYTDGHGTLESITSAATAAVVSSTTVVTGSAGNDVLVGTPGADTINGGAGNDVLNGGAGDDTLAGGIGADILRGGDGNDTLLLSQDALWSSGFACFNAGSPGHTGSGSLVSIVGKVASNDVIDGGAGYDLLLGTGGNDVIVLDDAYAASPSGYTARFVGIEAIQAGAGDDIVDLTSSLFAYGNVLIDGGDGNDVLWSSSGNDTLIGGAGNDSLDGGWGTDALAGGIGNDSYWVDNPGDVVSESANEGTDTVIASISYTLTDNVENLTLTGSGAINCVGNQLNNTLTGNGAANRLTGLGGDDSLIGGNGSDTLDGGTGADRLTGGAGADLYLFDRGGGQDLIVDSDPTAGVKDTAQFGSSIASNQLWFRHVGNNLELNVIGTTDKLTIQNWYAGTANHVEQFKAGDGKLLVDTDVEKLVQAMAAFAPPAAGQTTLPSNYQSSLAPVLAANWH